MPSKSQSILLGAGVTFALILVQLFLSVQGGQAGQYLSTVACCLAAVGGAGAAVWHYTSTYRLTLPAGPGAGLGAAATSLGYIAAYIVGEVMQAVGAFPSDEEIMERTREQLIAQGMAPESIDAAMQTGEMFTGVLGAVVSLVVLAVLGAIVGAIAASIFKKGEVDEAY